MSNFGAKHIQEFIDQKVPLPTINQIDLHPFMRHPEIVKICEDNGILLEVSMASSAAVLSAHVGSGRHLLPHASDRVKV